MAVTGSLPPQLPDGARLVHIGFPKTGTTSVQSSLELSRGRLPELGVVYPGTERYHKRASVAVVGATVRIGDPLPDMRDWTALVEEVRRVEERRVVVSSEWLCEADDDAARRVVAELGGDAVHVVATLRPLAKILPSSWQQYVQNGMRTSYSGWLDGMLRRPPYEAPTRSFWHRHRHADILGRWTSVVGADRVTVVVVDEHDRSLLLRQFEAMLGLPAGILVPHERENRSLSRPEVELVRHLNKEFKENQNWSDALYRVAVRIAVAEHLARRIHGSPVGPAIATPQWALEAAAELGAATAKQIVASGIRVVGDLDVLSRVPESEASGEAVDDTLLPANVAADAVASAVNAARRFGYRQGRKLPLSPALAEQSRLWRALRRPAVLRVRDKFRSGDRQD